MAVKSVYIKLSTSFILCIIGIAALTYLGKSCGTDVSPEIAGIVTAYVFGRAGMKGAMAYSASKDPACNTAEVIDKLK